MPLGYQLTLTETLLPLAGSAAPQPLPGDWEVGRLVLAQDFRADVDTLRHCLRVALEYGCGSTRVGHLYATCTNVLSRLYRRFGFSEFAKDVTLPGTSKSYALIRGSAAAVSGGLAGRPVAPTH